MFGSALDSGEAIVCSFWNAKTISLYEEDIANRFIVSMVNVHHRLLGSKPLDPRPECCFRRVRSFGVGQSWLTQPGRVGLEGYRPAMFQAQALHFLVC